MKRLQALVAWLDKRFPQSGASCLEVATLLAALTAAVIAIWKFLAADTSQLTELLKAVAWPVVACVGMFAFREPIGRFLSGLAQRVKKFSAFKVEFELTEVTAKQVTGPVLNEIRSSEPMFVGDSAGQIFAQLLEERHADYVVIDLSDGGEWLSSRLFIVAAMFGGMRGVRCMVFTAGTGGNADAFVGIASLQDVRWRLARMCPWFEVALAKAVTGAVPYDPGQMAPGTPIFRTDRGGYEPYVAGTIARTFIDLLQVKGFDLRLISWGDGSGVPTSGINLVVVGIDSNGLLHIRVLDTNDVRTDTFETTDNSGALHLKSADASGKSLSDALESNLPTTQAQAIATLKLQITGLLPPHVLTSAEKAQLISDVTAIVDQTQVKTAPGTIGWEKIRDNPPVWERAEWVTQSRLRTLLGDGLSKASVINPGERPKQEVVRSVLSQPASFVAGITSARFSELFDRVTMLEQVAHQVARAGDGEAEKDEK